MANADFYTNTYNPDVLSCLANLSNDEVFTPPEIVNQMLDMLPQELFRDPTATFLDPACKSGVFLREIAKRLLVGLEDQIPELQTRIKHIFKKQVFGIAITEMTSLLSRRSVYCSKYPNGKYSIAPFGDIEGNIRFKIIKHIWRDRKCVFCGASLGEYGYKSEGGPREEGLESHAYEIIHTSMPEEIFKMKFDVIVGNPPYQLSDGGFNASATPIYNKFVEQALKLRPRYMSMIIPARWFSGGRGLDEFRRTMLNDNHIRELVDFTDSNDCFPGVDVAGGICYFLWDRDNPGTCLVKNMHNGTTNEANRHLNSHKTFVRYNESISILEKVARLKEPTLDNFVSGQKPFGLRTFARPSGKGDIVLRWNGGKGLIKLDEVLAGTEMIDKWKVITSRVSFEHAGRPDKDGKRRLLSILEVLPPKTVCSETYIVISSFDDEAKAKNLLQYMTTKFARFLLSQVSTSQMVTRSSFTFVPFQDFSEPWTDEKLYAKYGITAEEKAFIESMIRPMDLGGDDDE